MAKSASSGQSSRSSDKAPARSKFVEAPQAIDESDDEAEEPKVRIDGFKPVRILTARPPKKLAFGRRSKKPVKRSLGQGSVDQDAGVAASVDDRQQEFLENLSEDRHPRKDLDDTKTRLAALLSEIDSLVKQTPALLNDIQSHPLLRQCFEPFNRAASVTNVNDFGLPSVAPKLWADRDRSSRETALEFTGRIYADHLPEMTLTYLRDLDPLLYSTLNTWIGRNTKPIPKKFVKFFQGGKGARSLKVDQELQDLGIKKPSDAYSKLPNDRKRADRLYQAALRRQI